MVFLILMLIIVAGFNALTNMPKLEDPHMQARVVQMYTPYPGADALRVEAEITRKLENKIREVPEIKTIIAISRPGMSFLSLELADRVTDTRPVVIRLREKLAEVTDLPADALPTNFNDKRILAHSGIIALTWHSDSPVNYAILGRHARELQSRLINIQATDFVDISGLPNEEIRVTVDDDRLSAHGLTAADVIARIRASDSRGSAGQVSGDTNSFVIEVDGAFDSLDRIRKVPLGFDVTGAALRLGDVAAVERRVEDPVSALALLNGDWGVTISARMLEDFRIEDWSDSVGALVSEYEKILPSNVRIGRIFDQHEYADSRLGNLFNNMLAGAFVVVAVLFFSLGWRASLVSASILPLTMLVTLATASAFGFRIEQMLISGMIVSLGIMVDNAIVMTDEIQQRLLEGCERSKAVAVTVRKLALPLFGSTLTTIIAFMPLMLMPGAPGDFLIGIPVAVIASLVGSYVISFTIISALAGRVVEGRGERGDARARVWWRDGISGGRFAATFERSLRWSLTRPIRSIALAMVVPVAGFMLSSQLDEQFFPTSDRNQFQIQLNLPAQASMEETRRAILAAHDKVMNTDGVTSAYWYSGSTAPKFYYSLIGANEGVVSYAEAMVTTENYGVVPDVISGLQRELEILLPEVFVVVKQLDLGPPVQAPVQVRVSGPDLAMLDDLGNRIRSIMMEDPRVTGTQANLNVGRPLVLVKAREDEVSVAGLTLRGVAQQINQLTSGVVATQLIEETHPVPVRVVMNRNDRSDLNDIRDLGLTSGVGELETDQSFADVPLSAIADVELVPRVGVVPRRDGQRVNTISAWISQGVLPSQVLTRIEQRLAEEGIVTGGGELPSGYTMSIGGESEKRDEAVAELLGPVGMLIVMMIMAIVLTFNSFRLAAVTFMAATQAAALGLFSLWVFGMPITFVVIIAIMGLIGLSMNATIVILSELRGIDAARAGDQDAVVKGVMHTGRHILSTTLTTVGGFMPLILAPGLLWPPFGIAIAGGAVLSMIISFYFAPAAFLWLTRRRSVAAPGAKKKLASKSETKLVQSS